jgi:Holliday junction resolvase RusA-like endonuclease
MLILEIFGDPIPLARPRACKRGNFVTIYDSQQKEKEIVKWQARAQYREEPLQGPLFVELLYGMKIPKQTSKVKYRQMLQGMIVPITKPDIDNLIKFTFDCLKGIVFGDDSQIAELAAKKFYSEKPRTVIRVLTIDEVRATSVGRFNRELPSESHS